MLRFVRALVLLFGFTCASEAQQPTHSLELWAGADYDPAIPHPSEVLGHELGARLTPSAEIRRYFEALRTAAPDRVLLGEYARTWERRPAIWVAISSSGNIARLEQIREVSMALSDPRTMPKNRARTLMENQPVIVWLAYSVHGDEVSPAEASMAVAHHLLAARGDPRVTTMMKDAVVVIVPTQNPDGRERFLAIHESARGLEIDSDELSAERDRNVWPRGRYNHYLFDLNRDWFALTQPETRGHAQLMLRWRPQVVVDAHEMTETDASFFFPPEADPINPLLPEAQMRSRALFGRALGAMFDREGLDYFTREVFDAFYPGYGDNWPSYLGAVGMTYEQATAGGLAGRRSTGEILTLFQTLRSHFLVSLSTIETAVAHRETLLSDFYAYRASAIEEGRRRGAWVLPLSEDDSGAVERLVDLLSLQGIEIDRAQTAFNACGRSHAAGTYIVNLAQPQSRLADVLLDPTIKMSDEFVAEQERRRGKRLPSQMYDVTAWSLSEAFNVRAVLCRGVSVKTMRVRRERDEKPRRIGSGDAVAYVIPAGSQAIRFLTAALRSGLKVRSPDEAFTLGGRQYRAGSMIVTRAGNPPNLLELLDEALVTSRAEAIAVTDTWVTEGPGVGSERTVTFPATKIALAWDEPTRPTSAGSIRYIIEREYGYPVTIIRTALLSSADLSRYDVLIIPDGEGFRDKVGTEATDMLRGWVRRGGVLIGIGGAVELLARPESRLLSTRRERLAVEDEGERTDEKKKDRASTPGDADEQISNRKPAHTADDDDSDPESNADSEHDPEDKALHGTVSGTLIADEKAYAAALRPKKSAPDEAPGALARAVVDADHWLAAGAASTVNVMVTGSSIFQPLRLDKGVNVVRFAQPSDLVAAGHLWEENRKQLGFKPVVMVQPEERGFVIAFTQDPTARGFLRGMDVLFMNAVLRAPAHAKRVRHTSERSAARHSARAIAKPH